MSGSLLYDERIIPGPPDLGGHNMYIIRLQIGDATKVMISTSHSCVPFPSFFGIDWVSIAVDLGRVECSARDDPLGEALP